MRDFLYKSLLEVTCEWAIYIQILVCPFYVLFCNVRFNLQSGYVYDVNTDFS